MIDQAPGFDLIVPRIGDYFEPLHAVYSRRCLKIIEKLIYEGELKINRIFDFVRVKYISPEEIDRFDPKHLSFFNINTAADLEKAKKLIKPE